ncbi:unnamed protein product [Linum tenue]|uniref:Uncharacterized protein n=1 Tax=Linum tenue TaxID=586396 RepID=A0AAV0QWP9_9ROSI|nr:unnamed protein product [Linum tenue]
MALVFRVEFDGEGKVIASPQKEKLPSVRKWFVIHPTCQDRLERSGKLQGNCHHEPPNSQHQ